jgi:transposase
VVVSNPRKTRAIAEAKVKTDKVDARILAQLLAADFLPETWVADDRTRMLRRLVMRRTHLVKQRTRLKNQVHGILSRNLVPTCPHADLFSGVGRRWLGSQVLPADEWRSVDALVRQLDFHGDERFCVTVRDECQGSSCSRRSARASRSRIMARFGPS